MSYLGARILQQYEPPGDLGRYLFLSTIKAALQTTAPREIL